MRKLFKGLSIFLAFGCWWGGTGSANAEPTLREDVRGIAQKIQKILESRNAHDIAVSQIAGEEGNTFGPGIQNLLIEELHGLKIKVDAKAPIRVQGSFRKGMVKNVGQMGDSILVKMDFALFDGTGDPITDIGAPLRIDLRRNGDIAKVLQTTGPIPGNGDYRDRNEEIQKNLAKNPAFIEGTKVFAGQGNPYAIEILAKPTVAALAVARQPRIQGNEIFVDIARGELYEVRFHNQSEREAAGTLAIDGIDNFTFSEVRDPKTGAPRYSRWIIGAKSNATIKGWHLRDQEPNNFLSFLVTNYGEGASRKAPIPQPSGKVGTITVTFAQAWTGEKPANERSADGGNETGFGPPISAKVQAVQRQIGVERAVITVRYSRQP